MKKKLLSIFLAAVMAMGMIPSTVQAAFSARTTEPESGNTYYTTLNPFYNSGYGMPNCTCYAWGRAYEILGSRPNLCTWQASLWYGYNEENNFYPYSSDITKPAVGAIACWGGGDGHVAVVEKIEGNRIYVSESKYSGQYFNYDWLNMNLTNLGYYSNPFLGYIYLLDGNSSSEPTTPPPSAPIKVTVTWENEYAMQARVSWPAVSGATSYEVEYNHVTDEYRKEPDYSSGTSFIATGVGHTNYNYRVRAVNSGGKSAWTVGTFASATASLSPASIAEGFYTLTPACAPNMRLDVSGADKGANVWIWTANGSDPQTFRFTGTDSGYYAITSKYSGMVLDAWGASTDSGTNVAQHPAADYFNASSGINQQWKLVDAGGGYYEIISRMSDNACLDVNGAGNTEQTNVQIWERNGTDAQKWKLTFVADSVPVHTHSLVKTPAKGATCTSAGSSAYWYCSGCNRYFSDASGENEITLAQTVINALGHSYANGECSRCGESDPNYKPPTVDVNLPPQYVYPLGKFTDVPMNQWFYPGVVSAYEFGLMKGNSAVTFNPYGDVTISEAITMAARIHNIYANGSETIRAAGTGEQWYQPYLDYAYENGVIRYAYYNSDVSQRATRAQFAEIFALALPDAALAARNSVGDNAIPDVSASDSCAPYIYKLYRAGVLAGSDANGTFHPATFITRAEAATIVSRMASSDNRVSLTLN